MIWPGYERESIKLKPTPTPLLLKKNWSLKVIWLTIDNYQQSGPWTWASQKPDRTTACCLLWSTPCCPQGVPQRVLSVPPMVPSLWTVPSLLTSLPHHLSGCLLLILQDTPPLQASPPFLTTVLCRGVSLCTALCSSSTSANLSDQLEDWM